MRYIINIFCYHHPTKFYFVFPYVCMICVQYVPNLPVPLLQLGLGIRENGGEKKGDDGSNSITEC